MGTYVFQPCDSEGHRNILLMCVTLWRRQVGIEVAGHQQFCPAEPLADGRDDSLCGQDAFQGDIAPHNMPPFPSWRQMKSGNVRDVEAKRLQGEVLRLAVEYRDASTM